MKNISNSNDNFDYLDDKNVKLTDLVGEEFLQLFQDAFSKAIGVAAITTDKNGTPITEGSNFTDFCMQLNRGSSEGLRRCMESDAAGGKESSETGRPAVYYCGSGLMDFAAPIMINGKQIASIIGGQTLPSAPEKEKFKQFAKEIGVDEEKYLNALDKVKIVPEDKVRAAADLLFIVANEISKIGYQRLVLTRISSAIHADIMNIMAAIQELTASASSVTENQSALTDEIKSVTTIAHRINNVTEAIESIADRIRMLGLNASIEAARVGEAGAGFGVVAKEIHKLSGESKGTVGEIKQFTSQIQGSLTETNKASSSTLSTIEQQEAGLKTILESIERIANMTELLNNLASDK
ncbi:PocR ligand-binding domain-containing protein [Clostridium oryzae]|uniref:Putative sensory transducer protein YfmS n=1 Tax=Clostridium oryzae TaxID=1450648 RepID=A0A1V4IDA0_9CLOT|nr:PocR ligand-binding domain-containing protein [Clostridium oryzae]OPJ57899.1 putative sensory transducer protein YfmS [Clostridium oryzae]